MAYGRKTGGRQVGTGNKAISTLREQVDKAAGDEPLPVLLTRIGMIAMRAKDYQTAIAAFSKAAQYTYPRLQAIAMEVTEPVIYPPLVVGDDGRASIPPNWPGTVIRFTRRTKNLDGTVTDELVGEGDIRHTIAFK